MSASEDPRIELILEHIMQLAANRLGHRTPQSDRGDVVDAIVCGLNMLGEELERTLVSREAMLRQRNRAEEANLAKTRFLADISHELRTPLGAIAGFNRLLLEKGRQLDLPDDFVKFQKYIEINSDLLMNLINDVLEVSRIEAGEIDIIEEDFNLAELVEGIHSSYLTRASEAGLSFDCHLSGCLPEPMRTDRVKLTQILINLISNAIKFSPAGGHLELRVDGDADRVEFQIHDRGVGIPPDRLEEIFERFTQLEPIAQGVPKGVGLGLHITRSLTEALGGEISVRSEPGVGSCFTLLVPNLQGHALPSPTTAPAALPLFAPGSRVLAVEDNPINQELLQAILEEMGIDTELADNGRIGIDRALDLTRQGKAPDLILMDLQMPVMGGLEAIEIIANTAELRHIPIVVLTANALDVQRQAIGDAGIVDYLTKPIDFERLAAILSRFLSAAT